MWWLKSYTISKPLHYVLFRLVSLWLLNNQLAYRIEQVRSLVIFVLNIRAGYFRLA